MKRVTSLFLAVIMALSAVLVLPGCDKQNVHILTRGEWINEIANKFQMRECYSNEQYFDDVGPSNEYFKAIQACSEWNIIDKGGNFEPNERAGVNFAMITAVKAIGLDRIAKSVDGKALNSDEEIIAYFNDHSKIKYISDSLLYEDTAKQIIDEIGTMYSNIKLTQYHDIKLTDKAVTPKESDIVFSADGETATVRNGEFKVGDIVCFEPSVKYPEGKYAKIESIDGNTVKYTTPALEEVAEHVTVCGTYEPEILGVIPLSEGVKVEAIDGAEAKPQYYQSKNGPQIIYLNDANRGGDMIQVADNSVNLGEVELKIYETFKSGNASVTVSGAVKLKNITATVDIDTWGPIVNKANVSVSDTFETNIAVSGKIEKSFPIARIPCRLFGIIGADVVLALKIGLEGTVTLMLSVDTSEGVEYTPITIPKYHANGSNPNLDVELKVKVYVRPEFKVEFVIGPACIVSLGAYAGVESTVKTKVAGTSDDVGCEDISAYLTLAIFVGAEDKNDSLLGKLGVKKTWTIWTSSNSPIKKKWHIEEGEIVPKCTRGKKNEKSTEDENTSPGETEIDEELINYILDIDENLIISSYYILLDEGTCDKLLVKSIPAGYSASDIVITSDNEAVARAESNGTITAVGSGSCLLKIATSDGRYVRYCAVRVLASYDVEFTPLSAVRKSTCAVAV